MSDVTPILTGRINLKRLTPYLLDGLTPSFTVSLDRQPVRYSRLEIEVAGATVSNGIVYVNGNAVGETNQYVITDRVTAGRWALRVRSGYLEREVTLDAASAEPIIQDNLTTDAWKLFIEDGQFGREVVVSSQDDSIVLADLDVPGNNYKIVISDGQRGLDPTNRLSELFQFSENTIVAGTMNWFTIASLTITGITGGTIKVKAVNAFGQPVNQEKVVSNNLPIRFYAQSGRIRMMQQGQEKVAKYKLMAEPDADIQEADIIYGLSGVFGMTLGQVSFAEKIYDFDGLTHHTEAEIMDL